MKSLWLAAASVAALTLASTGALAQAASTPPAAAAPAPKHFGTWGIDLTALDRTVKPGNSFYGYANGGWYASAEIPADQASTGVSYDIYNASQLQILDIITTSASNPTTEAARQIGGLYNAFMDEARLEQLDAAPMQADLDAIRAAGSQADFARLQGASLRGFGVSLFAAGVQTDPRHPDRNILVIGTAGLGLPDRDYYLTDAFRPQREAYQAYVGRSLQLIGWADPDASAKAVMEFETRVATVTWPVADRRDEEKINNPMSAAELAALAPDFPWSDYFRGAGVNVDHLTVIEKSSFEPIAKIFAETPVETLRAWAAFHLVNQASPYLSKRFVDSRFRFIQAMTGQQQLRVRWKRGVSLVDGTLGEAIGREYVARYFPPEAKAKAEELVANLKAAMAARIRRATWMAPSTKAEALRKLDLLRVKIGYPSKWRDYSGLRIDSGDLYGDVKRSSAFEWAFQISKLGKPVDRDEWFLTPQTVDAYNNPRGNEIVFPAGILQAPLFDAQADPAVNYGGIGGVIGHEITHGFDDQGRKYDANGVLRDWWTAQDAAAFQVQAERLAGQYDAYEGVPGAHINGHLTLGENIADLGGVTLALEAYHTSLHGRPAPVLDGVTGDQRVLLGWAQGWRGKDREGSIRQQMASDPHSPREWRVSGPVRNVDAWYDAFGVKPGDKLYLKPEDRVRIW